MARVKSAKTPHVVRFVAVVELLVHALADLCEARVERLLVDAQHAAREQRELEVTHVRVDRRIDAGILHLTDDLLAVDARAMHLADGGGSKGHRLERFKEPLERLIELAL